MSKTSREKKKKLVKSQEKVSGFDKHPWEREYQVFKKLLVNSYGSEIGTILLERFDKQHLRDANADYHCMDNYRTCRKSDKDMYADYKKIKEDGCCGFIDSQYNINGEIYLIGCNYGH